MTSTRITLLIGVLQCCLPAAASEPSGDEFFSTRVAPILVTNCLTCHSDSLSEGQLNLSTHAGLVKGGESGEVVVAGKPDESYLVQRVRDHEMPPEGKGKPLSDEQVATIAAWVAKGAAWPKGRTLSELDLTTEKRAGHDWWSWQSPKCSDLPTVKDITWVRSPLDTHIFARLAEKSLKPSPQSDRATLIRRLYFGVVGLPPTPEEIREFLADESPDAYERLVDRLLTSPRYGERWGRHWLDVVRFGETNGYETNTPRDNAWHYRDWVIRSLNEDKPYDRFVIEQLAGDQLGAGAATGFLVGGTHDVVGINNIEGQLQQRLDDLDDMVGTTASAFLGLTLSCAKCHNHKFDPLAQADFFRFAAVFSGVQHGDRQVEMPDFERRRRDAERMQREIERLDSRLAVLDRAIQDATNTIANVGTAQTSPRRASVTPVLNVDRFSPVEARYIRFTIEATNLYEPCLDELEIFTAGEKPTNVALASTGAKATASGVYNNGREPIHQLAHVNDGQYGNSRSWISNETGRGWVEIELPKTETIDRVVWGRDRKREFKDRTATRYRIEIAVEPGKWTLVASSADRKAFNPDTAVEPMLDFLPAEQAAEYRQMKSQRDALVSQMPRPTALAYAGTFVSQPAAMKRLHRGDVMQPREEVAPGSVEKLGTELTLESSASDAKRRLALGRWIADARHPLTARVIVNRLWHYHFVTGLVATPSNFGFLGGKPSHPDLLDRLAHELVRREWSLKAMHRAMLTSATFRQASADRPEAAAIDAQCRLLWRFPPRRLEAEPIRDATLAVAGTIDLQMGGPGYSVFVPNNNYVRVYDPLKEFGPSQWRRMVYQTKPRMQHDATYGELDCPDASRVMPSRNVSTTALQSLNLLNSPFVIQQAGFFAERLKRESAGDVRGAVARGFELAFGREPQSDELVAAVHVAEKHGLETFCRALLNASEFIYVN